MIIRPERAGEFPVIRELVRSAFATARVADGNEHEFVDRLRAGENYIPELALVMERDGGLIAHIMLTKFAIAAAGESHDALLLAPVCVTIDQRNKGVGARLIGEALDRGRKLGYGAVIVLGDPEYYSRFGFRPSVLLGVRNCDGIEDRYAMALELVPGALDGVRGTITFPS